MDFTTLFNDLCAYEAVLLPQHLFFMIETSFFVYSDNPMFKIVFFTTQILLLQLLLLVNEVIFNSISWAFRCFKQHVV